MTNKEIRFVASLEAEKSVAEDGLSILDDIQMPIGRIVERHSLSGWSKRSWHLRVEVRRELTKEPINVDQAADVGHHVQNLCSKIQRWCLCLRGLSSANNEQRKSRREPTGPYALLLSFLRAVSSGREGTRTAVSWELPPTRTTTLPARSCKFARRLRKGTARVDLENAALNVETLCTFKRMERTYPL